MTILPVFVELTQLASMQNDNAISYELRRSATRCWLSKVTRV